LDQIKDIRGIITEQPQTVTEAATTASSQSLNFKYKIKLHFKIQYLSWTFPFYVTDKLPVKAILGLDFLKHTRAVINIAKQTITFPYNQPLVLLLNNDQTASNDQPSESTGPKFGKNLNKDQTETLTQLLEEFPNTITKKLGRTNLIQYHINIKPGHIVRTRPYQFSPVKTEILRNHIDTLLKEGVIKESMSPFSSPAFIIPKKEGKTRMVINYRALNQGLVLEATPMPTLQSSFEHLGKAKWFTLLDLNSAYNQIPLDDESKKYTAFVVPWAQYEFNFVPFGLANGSMVLTDLMNKIFSDIKFKYLYSFFDDLVIYSDTFEEHVVHIREVLNRLKNAGLTVNPSKMTVASNQIEFLGHVIKDNTLSISRERTKPIDQFPIPKNIKQLSRFLGMTAFYSKFIPNYASISAPLNQLKRKGQKFIWGKEQENAFNSLKAALTSSPVLKMPNFDLPFILHTDASRSSISAIVSQRYKDALLPVAYASRPTNIHEKNYSAFELETLAITYFLNKFRTYLEHRHFELYTDSNALTWLLNHPRQVGKIARWITLINTFQFSVYHIKGKNNVVADCLSRMFEEQTPPTSHLTNSIDSTPQVNLLFKLPEAFKDIREHQAEDPTIQKTIKNLKGKHPPQYYFFQDGILTHKTAKQTKPRVVIPERLIPLLFKYYHLAPSTAHLGIKKTWSRIEPHFWSEHLKDTISNMVKTCTVCQRNKQAQNTKIGFLSSEIPTRPFEKVFIDHIGPLPRSKKGNRYILTIVDAFSKYSVFLPAKNTTSKTTINLLQTGLFAYFGFPKYLVSDNNASFRSKEFSDMCLQFGIQNITTTPYYPNPSLAERVNKNIKIAIRIYHSQHQDEWDKQLHFFQVAFNSAKHRSTGHSPAELFLSFQINHPLELNWNLDKLIPASKFHPDIKDKWKLAHQNLQKARAAREKQFNKGRQPPNYKVGDWVMFKLQHQSKAIHKINAKLLPLWSEPAIIQAFTSPVTVLLMDPKSGKTIRRAHVTQLKRYFRPQY
jgi:transposase InsO family protein